MSVFNLLRPRGSKKETATTSATVKVVSHAPVSAAKIARSVTPAPPLSAAEKADSAVPRQIVPPAPASASAAAVQSNYQPDAITVISAKRAAELAEIQTHLTAIETLRRSVQANFVQEQQMRRDELTQIQAQIQQETQASHQRSEELKDLAVRLQPSAPLQRNLQTAQQQLSQSELFLDSMTQKVNHQTEQLRVSLQKRDESQQQLTHVQQQAKDVLEKLQSQQNLSGILSIINADLNRIKKLQQDEKQQQAQVDVLTENYQTGKTQLESAQANLLKAQTQQQQAKIDLRQAQDKIKQERDNDPEGEQLYQQLQTSQTATKTKLQQLQERLQHQTIVLQHLTASETNSN